MSAERRPYGWRRKWDVEQPGWLEVMQRPPGARAGGTAPDAAAGLGTRRDNVIEWLRSKGAHSARTSD